MSAPLVLSIQSRVAYGHVGNSAAAFVLQRLGCAVVELPTTLLSAHPGHGRPGGGPVDPALLADLLGGLERIGVLRRIAAVLVGYLGRAETGILAAQTIATLKAARPDLRVLIDPVMGDRAGGCYVDAAVVGVFRAQLMPLADIATPNHFEAELLAARALPEAVAALEAIGRLGPDTPVITSFEAAPGRLATIIRSAGTAFGAARAALPNPPHGLGDSLAAALLAHHLHGLDPVAALARAVGSVEALIEASTGCDELALVAHQDLLVDAPPVRLGRLAAP